MAFCINTLLLFTFLFQFVLTQKYLQIRGIGRNCSNENNILGVCQPADTCKSAYDKILNSNEHDYNICSYQGEVQIVCCPDIYQITKLPKPKLRKAIRNCDNYMASAKMHLAVQITNGTVVQSKGEYPHAAALAYKYSNKYITFYKFTCGGTLISPNFVITAEHCINTPNEIKPTFVRLGEIDIPYNVTTMNQDIDYSVEKFFNNNYNLGTKQNDIALIKLNRVVTFSNTIHPACLYTIDDLGNDRTLEIIGWGQTNYDGSSKSIRLIRGEVNFITYINCIESLKNKKMRAVTVTQICADAVNKSGTAEGDSGGPLQINLEDKKLYYLVGITSYGTGEIGIYTKISSYLDWIENIVWLD